MKKLGRMFFKDKRIVVDAEPHVMQKIRSLFPDTQWIGEPGRFTHKPISLSNTLSICRDLTWVLERFPMDLEEELRTILYQKSEEYDNILKAVSSADLDTSLNLSQEAWEMAITLRDHQRAFRNMAKKVKKMLLADTMGVGKTFSALSLLADPENRPAIIVVPTNLPLQWERQLKRMYPNATSHTIRGHKTYPLPDVDVIFTTYGRLKPWQDIIMAKNFKTGIFDEIQEVRHTGTAKREMCSMLSRKCEYTIGLSGTPIYNMGGEIWSVLDTVRDNCLGDEQGFRSEWCGWDGKVKETSILNGYLKNMGLMLRRTREDIGMKGGDVTKDVITLDADLEKLKEVKQVAKMLALSVLSGRVGEDSDSAREFDWKLRMATGIAKAKPTAEFVRMVVENGEKVILTGWHRDVYDVWLKELRDLNPVMFTGSETPAQKEKALRAFIDGDAKIFILSLRSGAGIDGLQQVCSTVIHGELDWSPHVMDQLNARVDREGQMRPVQLFYITINDGSDPFIMSLLMEKRSQHEGIVEGKTGEADILESVGSSSRIKDMAAAYLASIGEEVPVVIEETGLLKDVSDALRRLKLPSNTEDEMQRAIFTSLPGLIPDAVVEREYKISARSRLDFLVTRGDEKIAVECKIDNLKRAEVYKQVRRYTEEAGITSVILVAPWFGIQNFIVDEIPVVIVDTSVANI